MPLTLFNQIRLEKSIGTIMANLLLEVENLMVTKLYVGLALLFLIVIFTLQNVEVVSIKFLVWEFSISRAIMIFLVLSIGILLGWAFAEIGHHKKK